MKRGIQFLLVISLLISLPGCGGRYVNWARAILYQGIDLPPELQMPQELVKSATVYDQFTAIAHFDAVWLTHIVRRAYVQLHAYRRGLSRTQAQEYLIAQLAEAKKYISFYLLSLKELPLDEIDPPWRITLLINNRKPIEPTDIRAVTLSPEYHALFAPYYIEYKDAYLITFDAYDKQGIPLIGPNTEKISLRFVGVDKQLILEWSVFTKEEDEGTHYCNWSGSSRVCSKRVYKKASPT